jgi:DNA repair protein RecO
MKKEKELSIILKQIRYNERDLIVYFLTENLGKKVGLAKGAVHSKRFGGALGFLNCSTIEFTEKENSDSNLVRIESANLYKEFTNLNSNYENFVAASLIAEFCLKIIDESINNRELFVWFSQVLYYLEQNSISNLRLVNGFIIKSLRIMGFSPSFFNCSSCKKSASFFSQNQIQLYWKSKDASILCENCLKENSNLLESNFTIINELLLIYFAKLMTEKFKDYNSFQGEDLKLFKILCDFLPHHIPHFPKEGLKSLRFFLDTPINSLS